jgi:hypothetical protein
MWVSLNRLCLHSFTTKGTCSNSLYLHSVTCHNLLLNSTLNKLAVFLPCLIGLKCLYIHLNHWCSKSYCLLECNATLSGRSSPKFRSNGLPSSPGSSHLIRRQGISPKRFARIQHSTRRHIAKNSNLSLPWEPQVSHYGSNYWSTFRSLKA